MMARVMYKVERMVEFGDYGNFARLTPIAAKPFRFARNNDETVVTYAYNDGTDRTIDLVHKDREVDLDTFINADAYTK